MSRPVNSLIFGTPLAGQALDTSTNATVYSTPIAASTCSALSVQFEWTGTPTSTLTLWWSNKPNPSTADDTDWIQATDVTITGPAGSASKSGINVGLTGGGWYRVKCVTSGSTGALRAWASGKE